jgi:hypothetical protein
LKKYYIIIVVIKKLILYLHPGIYIAKTTAGTRGPAKLVIIAKTKSTL